MAQDRQEPAKERARARRAAVLIEINARLEELEGRKSHGRVEIHLLEGRITYVEFCERVTYR